jgi:uncharacterized membrane protein YgcG
MSEKKPQDQNNAADETPLTDDNLENVAGGIVDGGCTEPVFGGGGGFGGGGAGGSW